MIEDIVKDAKVRMGKSVEVFQKELAKTVSYTHLTLPTIYSV